MTDLTEAQERLKQLEIRIENSGDDHEAAGVLQDVTECIAAWMMAHSFATGHGDTITGLLDELSDQINALRNTIKDIGSNAQRQPSAQRPTQD